MQTYKFIKFEKSEDTGMGRVVYHCKNKKSGVQLGVVEHYPQWKQWVFSYVNPNTVFSKGCLDDMSHFLNQLNKGE